MKVTTILKILKLGATFYIEQDKVYTVDQDDIVATFELINSAQNSAQ